MRERPHDWLEESKMPSTSDAKTVPTATQAEKPIHYTYLKEFRVDQCPLFVQRKCTQHKPFTCFYWHFMNQRRRRPVRKRDGTFNYSPDVYCTKYDETTGVCRDGDECAFLHRTAGDTERRYHLRYYKTGICVYDTDQRGYCVKNGSHCAFAHGVHDLRNPVYDARELQAMEAIEEGGANGVTGPNNLDKERTALNEDPKWQDTNYVLANYKTEHCSKPPRLCRQGYACPQFHNNRDRRRSPKQFKYRSTPCPVVKQGDEWGDPSFCESGENCPYCHTRTEQQFHPEIYKSTKCNDIVSNGYCPRGPFCAFAHVDKEISAVRDLGPDHSTDLAAILSNALPSPANSNQTNSSKEDQVASNEMEPVTTPKANCMPELQTSTDHFGQASHPMPNPIGRPRSYSSSTNHSGESVPHYPKAPGSEREDHEASLRRTLQAIDDDAKLETLEKARRKQDAFMSGDISSVGHIPNAGLAGVKTMSPLATSFYPAADTVESVVGNALEDLNFDDINVEASLNKELINDTSAVNSPLSSTIPTSTLLASAPMNIPSTRGIHENNLSNLSPVASPIGTFSRSFQMAQDPTMDKAAAAFYGHSGSFSNSTFTYQSSSIYDYGTKNMSPSRMGTQPPLVSSMGTFNNMNSPSNISDVQRLRDELSSNRVKMTWEDGILQPNRSLYQYELWKRDVEESARRERIAEEQRDEALEKLAELQAKLDDSRVSGSLYLHSLIRVTELETLPLQKLQKIKAQLEDDLMTIEKVVFYQTSTTCMICKRQGRSITVVPCNHFVLCSQCAPTQKNCPYCKEEITSLSNISSTSL